MFGQRVTIWAKSHFEVKIKKSILNFHIKFSYLK